MPIQNPCDSHNDAIASLDAIANSHGAQPGPTNHLGPTYKMLCPLHADTNPSVTLSISPPKDGKHWVNAFCWVCQDPAWAQLQEALIRPLTRGSGGGGSGRGYPAWTETCVYESSVQPDTIVQSLRYDYPGIGAAPQGCPVVLGKDKQDEWIFCGNEDPHKECRPGRDGKPISSNGLRDLALHVHLWKPQDADAPAPPQYDPDGGPLAIVCEGEKAAQHIQMAGYIAVSSYGGAGKAHHSCWDRVAGYQLVGWPDHDGAGLKFWNTAGRLAEAAGAQVIGIVEVAETCAKGYDAADMFSEHGAAAVRQAIADCPWYVIPEEDEAPAAGGAGDSRPSIIGIPDNLEFQIAAAEQALLKANGTATEPVLYQFDATLGMLANDADANLVVQRLTVPLARRHLARAAYWWKPVKGGGEAETWPPTVIAQHMLDLPPAALPYLSGIRFAPCLRPDRSLAETPGYDAGVKSYLSIRPPEQVAAWPARDELLELVSEFPFASDTDRANWLALLLTPLIRPAIGNAPMAILAKRMPRTGATLLAELTSLIATGASPTRLQLGADDPETNKAIVSAGLSPRNRGMMLLDNVTGDIDRPSLADFLTAAHGYDARRLGRNDSHVHLPAGYYTVVATSNHADLSVELLQRAYRITLDAQTADPESRQFTIPDIARHVLERRQRLLNCAWSLVKYWHMAGMPSASKPIAGLGGFEGWRDTMAGILECVGVLGFLANLPKASDTDSMSKVQEFIAGWWENHHSNPLLTKILLGMADGAADDDESLLDIRGNTPKGRVTSMGSHLTRMEGVVYPIDGGEVVVRKGRRTSSGQEWYLASMNAKM